MPRYIVTVRERVDYTLTIEAPDAADAGSAAIAALVERGPAACTDLQVTDRQAIEIEETDPMAGERCTACDAPLESGQIGRCEECQ